jgi:hypothetical protein
MNQSLKLIPNHHAEKRSLHHDDGGSLFRRDCRIEYRLRCKQQTNVENTEYLVRYFACFNPKNKEAVLKV